MKDAIRSTMAALLYDLSAKRGIGLLTVCLMAVPICAALQAMAPRKTSGTGLARSERRHELVAAPIPVSLASIVTDPRLNGHLPLPSTLRKLLIPGADLAQAKPFFFAGSVDNRERAVNCLAAAAWYEAGNDPVGQRSVIQVVLNRLKHPAFPKTVCGVVLQGSERSTGCQFTFTCDGSLARRRPTPAAWTLARGRAEAALDGAVDTSVLQATHYHADYVTPWWSGQLERLAQVGRHIFYRWPGAEGRLSSKSSPISAEALMTTPLAFAQGANRTAILGVDAPVPSLAANPKAQPASISAVAPAMSRTSPATAASLAQVAVIAVDSRKPSGHWAMEALAHCPSEPACQVIAYDDADAVSRNAALPVQRRDRPVFMLVRDKFSGMTLALWDCRKNVRPNISQCLPDDPSEMRALMHEHLEK